MPSQIQREGSQSEINTQTISAAIQKHKLQQKQRTLERLTEVTRAHDAFCAQVNLEISACEQRHASIISGLRRANIARLHEVLSALHDLEERLHRRAAQVECDLTAAVQQLGVLLHDQLHDLGRT